MSKATGNKAGKSKVQIKTATSKHLGAGKLVKKTLAAKPSREKPGREKPGPEHAKPLASKIQPVKSPPKGGTKTIQSRASASAKPVPKPASKDIVARTMATAKQPAPKKTESVHKKMASRPKTVDVVLPPDYRPSDTEPFMNELHRAYFRKRLLDWKDDILRQTRETLAILHEDSTQHADLADRATSETDRATELRTRDRQRKLIAKIDAAIARIEDGSYGYCEDTGEPIGLKRLDARPIATLSVEAQERHERREKAYREE